MNIINGKSLAAAIKQEVASDVVALPSPPGLGVLLVGDDAASHVYVNLKEKAAKEAGIRTDIRRLPATTSDDALEQAIRTWNADTGTHAILLQLPLPPGHDTDRLVASIDPQKDVDGFHPQTIERLKQGTSAILSPVHEAVLRLIGATGVDPRNKSAVILANSETFADPLRHILQRAGFITAFMNPDNLDSDLLRQTDVIVSAVGRPGFVGRDLLKTGVIIIDVGTTKDEQGHVRGDFDPKDTDGLDGWYTPVPGGVGPMTVALLLKNVVRLAIKNTPA